MATNNGSALNHISYAERADAQQANLVQDIQDRNYHWNSTPEKFTLGMDFLPNGNVNFSLTEWAEDREDVTMSVEDAIRLRDTLIARYPLA